MEKIDISNIDFHSLTLLKNIQCSESRIYVDRENNLYKLYNDEKLSFRTARLKQKANERLYEINKKRTIEHAVIVNSSITEDNSLRGFKEEYKKGFYSLAKYKEFLTYDEFLEIYLGISEMVEERFHSNGILYSDMKLDNIIFSKMLNQLQYFLVDTDSSSISTNICDITFTSLIKDYLLRKNGVYYLLEKHFIKASPNFDKLIFLVIYLESLFEKMPVDIDGKEFSTTMDRLNVSDEGIDVFEELVYGDNNPLFFEWPYLHEIIEKPAKVLTKQCN